MSEKQIVLVQETRSIAVSTTSSQAALVVPAAAGEVPQPAGFGLTDPVLDPGVLTVPQLQPGGLAGEPAGWGVGQEGGDPQPVDVDEGQLRTRVGVFLPQDQPRPLRPAGQVDQAGRLRHPRPLPQIVVGLDRGMPTRLGDDVDHGLDAPVHRESEGELD